MFDTVATIISEAHSKFGNPPKEWLDLEDVMSAASETFSLYGLKAQHSLYGRTNKCTPAFFPTSDNALITAPDMLEPSYLEQLIGLETPTQHWEYIYAVHESLLEEYRIKGTLRCAFVRQGHDSPEFRLRLNYDPQGIQHRLHYYTKPVEVVEPTATVPLQTRFGFMFVHKTFLNCVPRFMGKVASLPDDQQPTAAQLSALSVVIGHSKTELEEWEPLFKKENTADRNVTGRNRTPILGRGSRF